MAHYPSAADYLRARGVEPAADFYARLEHLRHEAWTLAKISDVEQIEQVKQSLVKALAEGKSFREWQQALTPEMLALPRHYQETVFRTAMLSSYNGAKWTHFRAHAERRPILRYIAINDQRTRPAHHALHGLMMPVGDERWQQLAPPLGFNCFLPGTTVRGEFELGLKSRYTGEAVEITAGTGDRLAVTANHPVLTRRGWLPAHQVKEGDYLLAYGGVVNPLLARVFNDQYPPSPVEDVFETLRANGFGIADIAAFQFHGDAHLRESEVHVAGRDAHLIARMQAAGLHGIEQFHLVGAGARFTGQLAGDSAAQFDMAQRLLFADDAANVAARTANSLCHTTLAAFKYIAVFIKDAFTQGARLFTHSSPRGGQLALRAAGSGFDGEPLDGLRFALTAPCNTMRQQALTDNLTADAVALGETVFTLPGNIGLDDTVYDRIRQDVTGFAETSVAGVRRFHYSGHVYDFQTKNGLIVAGNIVVHNCRCTMVSLSEKQAKALGYSGAPGKLPTWEDDHGVSHTAAADKGWGSPERRDLTDYLRQKEAKAGLGRAVYDEGKPVPKPEPYLPPPPTDTASAARHHVVTHGQADGLEHGYLVDKDGRLIDTRSGKADSIDYTDILGLLAGATLYHNHPSATSLSAADIYLMADNGVAELVAYGTHEAAEYRAQTLVRAEIVKATLYDVDIAVKRFLSAAYKQGKMSKDEAIALRPHLTNTALDKMGVIKYSPVQMSHATQAAVRAHEAMIQEWLEQIK